MKHIEDDKILIKSLHEVKWYTAYQLKKEYPSKVGRKETRYFVKFLA